MGWRARTRSWGLVALVVVATGAAHAAVPSVRAWTKARSERLVRGDLARQERALVRCLVGGDVAAGEDLVERVAGIETALAGSGEEAANDELHWPGRCAPLARATADLVHLGRPTLRADEVERLALVLGKGRPLEGALRAIEALSSPTLGASGGPDLLEAVGGDPPEPWHPEVSAGALLDTYGPFPRQPFATARSSDGVTESIGRDALELPYGSGMGAGASLRIEAGEAGAAPTVRPVYTFELPRGSCTVDVGRWSVEACGTVIRAVSPSDADRLERDPHVEMAPARMLGTLEAPRDDRPRWMVTCLARGSVAAVVLPATTPRRHARIVPVVDGEPGLASIPPAPADQIRCDGEGTVEVVGVRMIGDGHLAIQQGVCSGGACAGEAVDVDDVVPEGLRPQDVDHVAVGMLGDELVVGWIARRRDVFIKRGRIAELARAPLRLLHRATRLPEPTRIDALSSPRAVALALASGDRPSFAIITIDDRGAARGVVPRRESR